MRSRQDLSISAAKNLPRSRRDLKISAAKNSPRFSLRCRSTSRRDVENLAEIQKFTNIMVRSRRDGGYLAAISPRFRISQTSWEISTFSARSRQSRRDGEYLARMSARFRILETSWQDVSKNFARVVFYLKTLPSDTARDIIVRSYIKYYPSACFSPNIV